jgi:hypothetical protein
MSVDRAWIRRWPRGWRLTVFTVAVIGTVVIVIPALIVGVGYLLGFGTCDRPDVAAVSSICSPLGRLLFVVVLVAIGMPPVLAWMRFLARALNFADTQLNLRDQLDQTTLRCLQPRNAVKLPFGQELISDRIESCSPFSHHVRFEGGVALTFWSVYPFHKRWLNVGDQVAVVYQTIPFFKDLKFAMAFCNGSEAPVRGVAARAQGASALIATTCILILSSMRPLFASGFIMLCSVLAIVDVLYLVLMTRAKRTLGDFIHRETKP